jgi:MYXO-CTERM domain-containing protein
VRSACLSDCANLANLTLFSGETCHASVSDGGAGTVPDAAAPGDMRDGCRCATAGAATDASDGLLALLLVGFVSRRRR